jgi:hypothetical protein
LEGSGVDYVYLGAHGGKINVRSLNESDHFKHVYHQDGVDIYKIIY